MRVEYVKCDSCGREFKGDYLKVTLERYKKKVDWEKEDSAFLCLELCESCSQRVVEFFTPLKDPYGGKDVRFEFAKQ